MVSSEAGSIEVPVEVSDERVQVARGSTVTIRVDADELTYVKARLTEAHGNAPE